MPAFASSEFRRSGAWLAEHTLDVLGGGVLVFNERSRIVQWSTRARELLAPDGTDLFGRRLTDPPLGLLSQSGRPLLEGWCPVTQAIWSGHGTAAELRHAERPGGPTSFLLSALPLHTPFGVLRGAIASIIPIDAAAFGVARPAMTPTGPTWFEHGLVARAVINRTGRSLDWNGALLELLGVDDDALASIPFSTWCDIDVAAVWSALAGGETVAGWCSLWAGSPEQRDAYASFRLAPDDAGGRVLLVELFDPYEFVFAPHLGDTGSADSPGTAEA